MSLGMSGRPKKIINREHLEYLRQLRFTWDEIASILGTSAKTIQRRAKEWGIGTYLSISDQSLDAVVRDIILQFPSSGEVMIRGHLQSRKVGAQSTLAKCLMT